MNVDEASFENRYSSVHCLNDLTRLELEIVL